MKQQLDPVSFCMTEPFTLSSRVKSAASWRNLLLSAYVCHFRLLLKACDSRWVLDLGVLLCASALCAAPWSHTKSAADALNWGQSCDPSCHCLWINQLFIQLLLEFQPYRGGVGVCTSVTLGEMFSGIWAPVWDTWGELVSDEESVKRIVPRINTRAHF